MGICLCIQIIIFFGGGWGVGRERERPNVFITPCRPQTDKIKARAGSAKYFILKWVESHVLVYKLNKFVPRSVSAILAIWYFDVVLSQKTAVITVMATRLRNKKAKPKRNDSEEGGGGNSLAKRSSRRQYPLKSRRKVIVEEADVVDLWLTVGAAKELTTDAAIARFLLSL